MSDLDEIQSERDFFWAVAYPNIDRRIDRYWQKFEPDCPLDFKEIFELIEDFNNFTNGKFEYEDLELFIAQQIWRDKCDRNSVVTPEFTKHLLKSASAKYLFRVFN